MRKTVTYLAAWFAAGVAAVALASAGVSMVGRQVTDGTRSAPLSAEQVRDELAAGSTSTARPPATSTPTKAPPAVASGDGSTGLPGGGPSGNGTPAGATAGAAGSGAPPTTPTTAPPPPAPSTKTYNLLGGTATLRFSAAGVTVVSAVPNAGFSVDISDAHDTGARVEFESEGHRSRVDGWWASGPRDEIREQD